MHAAQQLNCSVGGGAAAAAAEIEGGDLGLAGLRNETGEYNCFLNVIIQCLWRCADFRQQVGVHKSLAAALCSIPCATAWCRPDVCKSRCHAQCSFYVLALCSCLQVAAWNAAYCSADAVVGSLHALFQQLQQQEEQRCSGGGSGTLPPVDPNPLREALACLPGQQFRVGELYAGQRHTQLGKVQIRVGEPAVAFGLLRTT